MKIISKRKDYYDGVGRGMSDADLIFKRELTEHIVECDIRNNPLGNVLPVGDIVQKKYIDDCERSRQYNPFFRYIILHFCGVQYPLFICGLNDYVTSVDEAMGMAWPLGHNRVVSECGEYMDMIRWGGEIFTSPWNNKARYSWHDTEEKIALKMKSFFDLKGSPSQLNLKYNSPIVVEKIHSRDGLCHRVNDNVSLHGLASLIPPQMAYQEISMWMGTHYHRDTREMIVLPDEVRAAKHGFDKKSFRKAPTKRL